jgi:hypothetical protein
MLVSKISPLKSSISNRFTIVISICRILRQVSNNFAKVAQNAQLYTNRYRLISAIDSNMIISASLLSGKHFLRVEKNRADFALLNNSIRPMGKNTNFTGQ